MTGEATVFVVNPASANGSTGRRWPEMERRAGAAGLRGETLVSEAPGEAVELARSACERGAALVVAVGGDGTVNEVVNGLMLAPPERRADLAVLPRGTGMDFARTFRISSNVERAAAVARGGATRTLDVGRLGYASGDGSAGEAYFAGFASAGMSGAVAQRANASSKVLGGRISFLWATLAVFAKWRNSEIEVEVDGERRAARMLDVVVANVRYLNGGMLLCPEAEPDDGVFDVLLIGDITKRDLAATLPKVYRGTHLPHPKVELVRTPRVRVESATPLPVELDGEPPGTTPATFDLVPRAVRLRVPD